MHTYLKPLTDSVNELHKILYECILLVHSLPLVVEVEFVHMGVNQTQCLLIWTLLVLVWY